MFTPYSTLKLRNSYQLSMDKEIRGCQSKNRSGALHLTQKVDYGILLLTCIAKEPNLSIKKIAEKSRISFSFLQKIAGLLHNAGLITSTRGKYGGYTISKAPDELNLKEVIEALEGKVAIVPCLKENSNCKHSDYCAIRPTFRRINEEIQEHIVNKSLSYFIS